MIKENNSSHSQCILIVEDDPAIRDVFNYALELHGYQVHVAENGRIGLDLLPTIPRPCLIFLDLMMPIMNGWDFIDALEKDQNLSSIPVIVVSAYSDKAKNIKAKEILNKPLDLDALINTAKKWCFHP